MIDLRAINERSIVLADRLTAECERRMGGDSELREMSEHKLQTLSGIVAKMQRSNVTAIRARLALEKDGKDFMKNMGPAEILEGVTFWFRELATHEQRMDLFERLKADLAR